VAEAARSPGELISLPAGGGALRGLGERFTPDLHSGTANLTLPIEVPRGRNGLQPRLELSYSSGFGNGRFGLGWTVPVPGIARLTSRGVPRYRDDTDVFVLGGGHELVPVGDQNAAVVAHRPQVEGLFARITRHRGAGGPGWWEVATPDGLVSQYGSALPATGEPALTRDPDDPRRVFGWALTRTADPFGNLIVYDYERDRGESSAHRWDEPILKRIRYAEQRVDGDLRFLASVTFDYEARPDPFSDHRAGFERRTSVRCRAITTAVQTDTDLPVRRYELRYEQDAHNGVSLLAGVAVVHFDDAGAEQAGLPPMSFGYSRLRPERRTFDPVRGDDLPTASVADSDVELADLDGDGLPDVLELGDVPRYWRNLGELSFDRPRVVAATPVGMRLGNPGVQLLDADGDGTVDLLRTGGPDAGYFPAIAGGRWGAFRPRTSPGLALDDPAVQLLDVNGDGVTDAVQGGAELRCWIQDPERGWLAPLPGRHRAGERPPPTNLADARVRWADMTGDGLRDLVVIHEAALDYWPNEGWGQFGRPVRMPLPDRLPRFFDPGGVRLGDLDGDGCADLTYLDAEGLRVWFNRSGNRFSDAVVVRGLPSATEPDAVRICDLSGDGVAGVLWSRGVASVGGPAMRYLDLSDGVRPRLLTTIDNHLGASTSIKYSSSAAEARRDDRAPSTRWRTRLPFPVAVVSSVATEDVLSGNRTTTRYRYRDGLWDGTDRRFVGFGMVEQLETPSGPSPASAQPPTLTRTWFHLGLSSLDRAAQAWGGDPDVLEGDERIERSVAGLGGSGGRRAGLRALRGSVLRTERYALDGSARAALPYVVTEHAYDLREETGATPGRVFTVLAAAARTTRWERGSDPMTTFTLLGDYDDAGQARQRTEVALPRRSTRRRTLVTSAGTVAPDERRVLATHTRTAYAEPDPAGQLHIRDRVAGVRTFELVDPPEVVEPSTDDPPSLLRAQAAAALAVQVVFAALPTARTRLIGHVVHHYDGDAFTGLEPGRLGRFGGLSRSEELVFSDAILDAAYGADRPQYLGGSGVLPAGAPAIAAGELGHRRHAADAVYAAGYYVDTVRQRRESHGLVAGLQDALGNETAVGHDAFALFATSIRDPAGLLTTAEYDYRAGAASLIIDPNGTESVYRYHPTGLPAASYVRGAGGEGGGEDHPDVVYTYDLMAFVERAVPISVHTARRVRHGGDEADESVEVREYSDGFGRVVEVRKRADDLAFGASGDDVGLLVASPAGGPAGPVPGQAGGPAEGSLVGDRVAVSGRQLYDHAGNVVESYPPYFDRGWDFGARPPMGRPARMFYDGLGRRVRAVAPDGAEQRTLFGEPAALADPAAFEPSPWVVTVYDPNDLAPLSAGVAGTSLGTRAPTAHHYTPATAFLDALGRKVCTLVRNGPVPDQHWHATRSAYDATGNVLNVTDELGRTAVEHVYDLAGRPLRSRSIDAGVHTTVYDAAGRPVEERDGRGALRVRLHDALRRPTRVYARDEATQAVTLREALEYGDAGDPAQPDDDREAARARHVLGRLARHRDEAGIRTVERCDFAGNVTLVSRRVPSDAALAAGWTPDWDAAGAEDALEAGSHETATVFDAVGRAVYVTGPADASGHRAEVSMEYDRAGQLRHVEVDGTVYLQLAACDAAGRPLLVFRGNGVLTRYAYDGDTRRLIRLRSELANQDAIVWTGRGPALQDISYEYDLVGNVTRVRERVSEAGVPASALGADALDRVFGYDPLYRLTSATGRECDVAPAPPWAGAQRCADVTRVRAYTETYQHDPAGNVTRLEHGGAQVAGLVPQTNRLATLTVGSDVHTFGYDANGNLDRTNAERHFGWDHADRLVSFRVQPTPQSPPSVDARYLYDAGGERVKKWLRGPSPAGDASTTYIGGCFELHRWSIPGGGAGEASHVHVLDGDTRIALLRRGAPHPQDGGPAVQYPLGDHLDSAQVVVGGANSAGREFVSREEYTPYGETSFGSYGRKRYRFLGRERDDETGLTRLGRRYLASWLARWVSCDPTGAREGPNTYVYSRDNPLTRSDPAGAQSDATNTIPPYLRQEPEREWSLPQFPEPSVPPPAEVSGVDEGWRRAQDALLDISGFAEVSRRYREAAQTRDSQALAGAPLPGADAGPSGLSPPPLIEAFSVDRMLMESMTRYGPVLKDVGAPEMPDPAQAPPSTAEYDLEGRVMPRLEGQATNPGDLGYDLEGRQTREVEVPPPPIWDKERTSQLNAALGFFLISAAALAIAALWGVAVAGSTTLAQLTATTVAAVAGGLALVIGLVVNGIMYFEPKSASAGEQERAEAARNLEDQLKRIFPSLR
jgi:RHS repeat-associated protein